MCQQGFHGSYIETCELHHSRGWLRIFWNCLSQECEQGLRSATGALTCDCQRVFYRCFQLCRVTVRNQAGST